MEGTQGIERSRSEKHVLVVSNKNRCPQTERLPKLRARQGKGAVPKLAVGMGEGQRTESWFTGGLSSTAPPPFLRGRGYEKGKANSHK